MKFTSSLVIFALLGVSDARHHRHHHHQRYAHPKGDLVGLKGDHPVKWDYSTSKFVDTNEYLSEYKNAILDDDELESGQKILSNINQDPAVIKKKLQMSQDYKKNNKFTNQTKKVEKKEKDHSYDKMADDIQQFKMLSKNTETADGKIRRSSDHFKFTDIEARTQSFVQKKESAMKEEQQRLEKYKAIQEKEAAKLTKDMNHQWMLFEKGLEVENWQSARQTFAQLEGKGFHQRPLMVNAKKIYQESFAFPQVANNDDVVDQLVNLEAAQNNLNDNPENETLMNRFVEVAQDTAENFLKQYPGIWTDPSIEVKKERRQQQLAQLAKK